VRNVGYRFVPAKGERAERAPERTALRGYGGRATTPVR